MSDYYDILKIKSNASFSEIKSAYKRLALLHHPDKNGGKRESEEKFKLIYEAYKTLSNTAKRSVYDKKNHIVHSPQVKYRYNVNGYKSILKENDLFKPSKFHQPEVFVSKKKGMEFYLFWITLCMIFVLVAFLLIKT